MAKKSNVHLFVVVGVRTMHAGTYSSVWRESKTEGEAIKAAKELASKHPGEKFYVLTPISMYETGHVPAKETVLRTCKLTPQPRRKKVKGVGPMKGE